MTSQQRRNGVMFSMCLALVLVVASVSALNLALPSIAVDLGASDTDLTWIADAYTVALAALVLPRRCQIVCALLRRRQDGVLGLARWVPYNDRQGTAAKDGARDRPEQRAGDTATTACAKADDIGPLFPSRGENLLGRVAATNQGCHGDLLRE
jgi:hypothetical protein